MQLKKKLMFVLIPWKIFIFIFVFVLGTTFSRREVDKNKRSTFVDVFVWLCVLLWWIPSRTSGTVIVFFIRSFLAGPLVQLVCSLLDHS